MTKYGIVLNPKNLQVHLDIEADLARIKNGLVTFVIKVNRGVVVDYVIYENQRISPKSGVAKSSIAFTYRKTG